MSVNDEAKWNRYFMRTYRETILRNKKTSACSTRQDEEARNKKNPSKFIDTENRSVYCACTRRFKWFLLGEK